MEKRNLIVATSLCVLLSIVGIAWGQQHQSRLGGVGRNIARLTPAQMASSEKIGRLDQAAMAAMDAGQYDEVEDYARQSISVGHDSGLAQELLAASLNAQGKTEEALQAYKVIADDGDIEPRNEIPYALLLLKSGQWTQALAAYNKTLPCLGDADLIRANSHFSPDVPQPKELETVLHMAMGLTYLGGAWGSHAQHEEAMSEFNQAWQLAPDSGVTNYYYGYGWQHLGLKSPLKAANASKAKAAFQKVAALGEGKVKEDAEEALRRFH